MSKQKLTIIIGSICIILIIAGFLVMNYSAKIASNSINGSQRIDTSSSSTNDNSGNTAESESAENSIEDTDYTWEDSDITEITFNADYIMVDNQKGSAIEGTTITITSAGTYRLSGILNDGQVIIDTNDEESVKLILNGVSISSTSNSPIYVANSKQTIIVLVDGTKNYLIDTFNNTNNATLLSKDDLVISGNGELAVQGNANDAVRSNDGLIIESGIITVTSIDDGIRGKDYIAIKGGNITINSGGDGLKSDNDEEAKKGYISIEAGKITITTNKGDAIEAQTNLTITDGTFTLKSGGGSNTVQDEDISAKGLKAGVSIDIDEGTFSIDSADDSIHSNDIITINGGAFSISSGDDCIHADVSLEINGGTLHITKCFEGMESEVITVNNGFITISSSDDGINLVEASETTSTDFGGRPGGFGGPGGETPSENCIFYFNEGFIAIDSSGDGIDSNGYIEMSGGVLIINGPLSNDNAAIDYGGGSFKLTGGILVAVGSAGMAQAPSASSTQEFANLRFGAMQSANTIVNIQTVSGNDVLTFCPTKDFQSLVFSCPELETGTYNVFVGGSATGTSTYGLYEDGTYNEGINLGSFTISW